MDIDKHRVKEILDVLLQYTLQDYSKQASISDKGDELDAIAVGINTLGEEMTRRIEQSEANQKSLELKNEELKLQTDALKTSESRFRKLIESAPDALVIVNHKGIIQRVNGQTVKMFGYSSEELQNLPVEKLIPDSFAKGHKTHLKNYAQNPRLRLMGEGRELRGKRKDNTEFPVEIALSPIETGEGLLVSAAIRDVTRRKKIEATIKQVNAELKEKNELLQKKQEELESFSYSVSHDLRAPLRAISGFSQILMKKNSDQLNEKGKHYVKVISDSAIKMGQLIDDILAFSRLGRQTMSNGRVNLTSLFNEVYGEIPESETKSVTFELEELAIVKGDFALLKQAVQNLLSNAIKYSSKKKKPIIHVGSKTIDNAQVFYITDNGAGFDMRYYNKLFGVFQRLHLQSEFEGSGVGLALCKRIIERHEGRIWAESVLGESTTFFFTLNEN